MENVENLIWRKWHQLTDVLRVSLNSTVPAGVTPCYGDFQVLDTADDEGRSLPFAYALELGVVDMDSKMIHRAITRQIESRINPAIAARFGLKSNDKETVDRHYHPRILGSVKGKVSFKVHIVKVKPEDKMPFKQVGFWKRGVDHDVRASLKCGRASEGKAFGFEPNKPPYVNLAYPGKSGVFEPLFVKVSEVTGRELDTYFIKITAVDGPDNTVVVEAKEVDSKEAPAFLK